MYTKHNHALVNLQDNIVVYFQRHFNAFFPSLHYIITLKSSSETRLRAVFVFHKQWCIINATKQKINLFLKVTYE